MTDDAAAEERAEALATAFLADLTALVAAEVEKQVSTRLTALEAKVRAMADAERVRDGKCDEHDTMVAKALGEVAELKAEVAELAARVRPA